MRTKPTMKSEPSGFVDRNTCSFSDSRKCDVTVIYRLVCPDTSDVLGRVFDNVCPTVLCICVYDRSFHQTLPQAAPRHLRRKRRRSSRPYLWKNQDCFIDKARFFFRRSLACAFFRIYLVLHCPVPYQVPSRQSAGMPVSKHEIFVSSFFS